MPVWVVTGGSGFLGRHLLAAFGEDPGVGVRVVAIGRRCPSGWPLEAFAVADLDDGPGLAEALAGLGPEVVFHLAGRTPPADPAALYRANTRATVNLLDALRASGRPARVVLAGSAAELGPVPIEDLPVGEGRRCRPLDPYGLSKWFATAFGLAQGPPLEVLSARIFNPIGPGLPEGQAFGRFAASLAGPGPDPIALAAGDLEARRDFVDVRDVARALIALARRGRGGRVYHVGTGFSRAVGEGLDRLIRLSGRTARVDRLESGHRRGPADSRADIRRIRDEVGWTPRIPWEQSLDDLWLAAKAKADASPTSRRVA